MDKLLIRTFVGGVAITCIILFSIIYSVVVVALHEGALDSQYQNNEITLQEYCDKITDKGTRKDGLPVACYQIYEVQQEGRNCHLAGKVMRCYPNLVPTN